jgi:hypothetical protein
MDGEGGVERSCRVAGEGRAAGQEGTSAAALSTGPPLSEERGEKRRRLAAE